MKIALFGGTFDPIHSGHVRAAAAATRRFGLDRVLFVPSSHPPHKPNDHLTPFLHRFAMVSLACAGNPRFVPSLLEAPRRDHRVHYSIDTVRAARQRMDPADELYFLIGLDAFLDLPSWKSYRKLLNLVNFVVVSRPGFRTEDILQVIPSSLRRDPVTKLPKGSICLKHSTLQVMTGVHVAAASRDIRDALERGRTAKGLLPPLVEEYVVKNRVYSGEPEE